MVILETVDLQQRAGADVLLNKVSLSVEKGEIFAVIGPTGAGKTTLLRLINLLLTCAAVWQWSFRSRRFLIIRYMKT
jgi:ABC-type methionine transport system ATPase subunit